MAIFTPGVAVASISGSVAGQTFSRNRGGPYIRNRSIPITLTSPEALAAKARLASAAQSWSGLTAGQRDAWVAWAQANPSTNALGAPRTLTGEQAYNGNFARMDLAGLATLTDPPIVTAPDALTSLVLAADIGLGNVDITYTPTPLGASERIWILAAVTNSVGITYISNLIRFAAVSAAAQASPLDIQTEVEARLGTLVVGQTLHVQIAVFDGASGLLSQPIRDSAVVVST